MFAPFLPGHVVRELAFGNGVGDNFKFLLLKIRYFEMNKMNETENQISNAELSDRILNFKHKFQ